MKFCSNCGKQLEDSATVCDACGTPTEQLPVPAPSSAPSPVKESPALGIVALILSIIGFLTGILTIGTYLDLLAILCSLFLLWKSQEKSLKTNLSVAALVTASLSALTCIFVLNQKLAILFCVLLLIAIFLFKYKKIQKLQEKQRFLILAAVLIVLSISACGVLTKVAVSAHNNIPASTSETKETSGQEESAKDMLKAVKRYYRQKSYSAAITSAEKLIHKYPNSPQAEKANDILEKSKPLYANDLRKQLEEAIKAKEWNTATHLGQELSSKYAKYDAAKGVDTLLENVQKEKDYDTLCKSRDSKNWENVLKQSGDFLKDWPNSPNIKEVEAMQANAKEFYWNSLKTYQKNKSWLLALRDAKLLQTYFPKDPEIQSAIDSINRQISERRTELLALFVPERDEVRDLTWYTPSSAPKYVNDRCAIYPYLSKTDSGTVSLRLKVVYTGDNWLFLSGVIFDIDSQNNLLSYAQGDYYRDNAWGDVWEVIDKEANETDKNLLRSVANSEKTIIRFQGSLYHYDMTVSQAEKKAIQDTLELAEYL